MDIDLIEVFSAFQERPGDLDYLVSISDEGNIYFNRTSPKPWNA